MPTATHFAAGAPPIQMPVVYKNVRIPPGVSPGVVIGKGGQQKRQLEAETGARVVVDGDRGVVKLSGAGDHVDAAIRLLEELFQRSMTRSSQRGRYPAPLQVLYVLDEQYGNSTNSSVVFSEKNDDVSRSLSKAGSTGPMVYTLQPAAAEMAVDEFTAAMSSLSMAPRQMTTPVYLASQQQAAIRELLTTAGRAIQHDRTRFTELKIRFNFGKSMFFKGGISHGTTWTIHHLQKKKIPFDINSRYSNMVLPEQVEKLKQFLVQEGFSQVEEKSTVSVSLEAVTGGRDGRYGLSFIKHRTAESGSPSISIRKVKSGNSKLSFLALLAASPDEPDWRAKLLGMTHLEEDASTRSMLLEVADITYLTAPARLEFPELADHGLRVDKQRHKEKTIYQGNYSSREAAGQSIPVKVTVSKVQVVDSEGSPAGVSYEVAGTSPEVNELLVKMLAAEGELSWQQEAALEQHLGNLMSFARAAMHAACTCF